MKKRAGGSTGRGVGFRALTAAAWLSNSSGRLCKEGLRERPRARERGRLGLSVKPSGQTSIPGEASSLLGRRRHPSSLTKTAGALALERRARRRPEVHLD